MYFSYIKEVFGQKSMQKDSSQKFYHVNQKTHACMIQVRQNLDSNLELSGFPKLLSGLKSRIFLS